MTCTKQQHSASFAAPVGALHAPPSLGTSDLEYNFTFKTFIKGKDVKIQMGRGEEQWAC